MAQNPPTRFAAGFLAGTFVFAPILSSADRDVHQPHVPEIQYGVPFNTSGSIITINASGAASHANFGWGPNDVIVASSDAVTIQFIPTVASSLANPHTVYLVTLRRPSVLASDLLHPRGGRLPTDDFG